MEFKSPKLWPEFCRSKWNQALEIRLTQEVFQDSMLKSWQFIFFFKERQWTMITYFPQCLFKKNIYIFIFKWLLNFSFFSLKGKKSFRGCGVWTKVESIAHKIQRLLIQCWIQTLFSRREEHFPEVYNVLSGSLGSEGTL